MSAPRCSCGYQLTYITDICPVCLPNGLAPSRVAASNPFDLPSVETREDEEDRERRWHFFEQDCREFAEKEPDGFAAVLRAVSRAMKDQRELLPR